MTSVELGARFLGVAAAAALATVLLARLAPRIAWTDAPSAADAGRKRQRRAVPTVGGAALLLALLAAPVTGFDAGELDSLAASWPEPRWLALSLAALLAVGTLDDRFALAPLSKSVLSLAACLPLAVGAAERGAPAWALALAVGAFGAGQVLNTFDNADGALAGLCAAGFLVPQPFVAAACLGFLPLNLDAGSARNRSAAAPSAYLGDAGAFVLGFLVLATPRAWGILWLPLLDLARLSWVRIAAGSRPWIGDRRHLAHRMQRRGLSPAAVAALQALLALPAVLLVDRAIATGSCGPALLGLGLSALGFALAVRASRDPAGRAERSADGVPCPPPPASE